MPPQVPAGDLGVGGVAPLDLGKAGHRVAEMRQVNGARGVVVREAAVRRAVWQPLDYRESGIRELANVRSAPGRGRRVGDSDHQNGQHQRDKPHAHLMAPRVHVRHDISPTIDDPAPL